MYGERGTDGRRITTASSTSFSCNATCNRREKSNPIHKTTIYSKRDTFVSESVVRTSRDVWFVRLNARVIDQGHLCLERSIFRFFFGRSATQITRFQTLIWADVCFFNAFTFLFFKKYKQRKSKPRITRLKRDNKGAVLCAIRERVARRMRRKCFF